MNEILVKVRTFMRKHRFIGLGGAKLQVPGYEEFSHLRSISLGLRGMASPMRSSASVRLMRLGLIIEEAGELAAGLSNGDEEEVLDALGDLIYVVAGCAITFDLPLSEAFEEIHRSNMTKTCREETDNSLLEKGGAYEPPDLKKLLGRNTDES